MNNECIRIFTGIQLLPVDKSKNQDDAVFAAYLLFDESGDNAELFLPNEDDSVIVKREGKGKPWTNGEWQLIPLNGYQLKKAGKLPYNTISEDYGLEYGSGTLEVHVDAVEKGAKVLLIDDVLATGGTIAAAIELMHRLGAEVVHVLALLEIDGLQGRAVLNAKYPNIPVTSLVVS